MSDDTELLRRYAERRDESAFSEFVRLHIDLVYSAAIRQTGHDAHTAQDVTQIVFVAAARKAAMLARHPVVDAWLHQTTRYTAIDALRSQSRRQAREKEAPGMSVSLSESPVDWDKISPELDRIVDSLGGRDRDAVILRFFRGLSFAQIGLRLNLSEGGARTRVERALVKLKRRFASKGITSTAAALEIALSTHLVVAAPTGLATAVTGAAVAGIQGAGAWAIIFMTMNTTKALITAIAVAATGSTLYEARENHRAMSALAAVTHERDDMAERVENERMRMRQLQDRVAALSTRRSGGVGAVRPGPPPTAIDRRALMQNPEYRKLQVETLRGQLDDRYAALFKALGLRPDQLAQFKNLLVEKQMATTDASLAASDQGVTPSINPNLWVEAIASAANSVDNQIKSTLGDQGFGQFQQYEQTLPERAVVNQLQEALSYTPTALTDDQANQLIQLLQQAWPDGQAGKSNVDVNTVTGLTVVGGRPYWVTNQEMEAAQTVLSPEQMAALQQIQTQQQARRQLSLLLGGRPPP